jgi:adenosylcobinamide kinase/adenosylcobinamide-phosphate guanylyltransferase
MTAPHCRSILVLGGARSGKSRFAEGLARDTGFDRFYLATGRAWDEEMRARIETHKADRANDGWTTYEEPVDLVDALKALDQPGRVILVDCLTLWVTNLMMEEGRDVDAEGAALAASLTDIKATVIFVSNEVGLGIVPENKMARAFRDHAGRLHQAIAAEAADVYFVAAGLPLKMKG